MKVLAMVCQDDQYVDFEMDPRDDFKNAELVRICVINRNLNLKNLKNLKNTCSTKYIFVQSTITVSQFYKYIRRPLLKPSGPFY